jgi:hypothetical protein
MQTARMIARRLARLAHLAFLAFFLTPLVPSLAVALAHLKRRRLKAFFSSAAILAAATAGELFLAFGLQVSWMVYLVLHLVLSVGTGLLLVLSGPADRGGETGSPPEKSAKPPGLLAWGALFVVAATPIALWLSHFATRWGSKLVLKPSFSGVVILITVALFFPLGILAGWTVRRRDGRPPMVTTLAVLASFTAVPVPFLTGTVLAFWFGEKVLKFKDQANIVYYSHAAFVQGLFIAVCALVAVWLFFYVCSVRRFATFFLRLLLIIPISMGFFFQLSMLDSSYPETWHYERAVKELGRRDWKPAAQTCRWAVKRRLSYPSNAANIENLFVIALSTRDVRLWEEAARYADKYRDYSSSVAQLARGAHALAQPLTHMETIRLALTPVKPRTYLDNDWCAYLTAVAGSLPKTSETELLFRLRSLSSSAGRISLPSHGDTVDMRTAAAFYGLTATPVPFGDLGRSLRDGIPLLFKDPIRKDWGVVVGFDPSTKAILWYDFNSYDRNESNPLSRKEIQRMVAGKEGASAGTEQVFAETIRVCFLPFLRRRMEADNDAFIALRKNPSEEEKRALDPWVRRDLARRAIEARDAERFRALLAPLLTKYDWAKAMAVLPELGDFPEGQRSMDVSLTKDSLKRMDLWTLRFVADRLLRRMPTDPATALYAFKRLSLYDQSHGWVAYWLMHLASVANEEGPVVEGARRYVCLHDYDDASVRNALGKLAALRRPGNAAKREMARLVAHLPLYVGGRNKISHLRRWSPAYCAAMAALAGSREAGAWWWKRAVDLAPTNEAYIVNYADTLSSVGRKRESMRLMRRVSSLGAEGTP